LIDRQFSADQEIRYVVDLVEAFLKENPDKTIAILSLRNRRGFKYVDELSRRGIPYVDSLLQSTSSTRLSASTLYHILDYLSDPRSSTRLSTSYRVWRRAEREDELRWPFHQESPIC